MAVCSLAPSYTDYFKSKEGGLIPPFPLFLDSASDIMY